MPIRALNQQEFDSYISRLAQNDQSLTGLDLSNTLLGEESLRRLRDALENNQYLVNLNLSNCDLGSVGFSIFLELLESTVIIDTLMLDNNGLSEQQGELLLEALVDNDTIVRFSAEGNQFTQMQAKVIEGMSGLNNGLASDLDNLSPGVDAAPFYNSAFSFRQQFFAHYRGLLNSSAAEQEDSDMSWLPESGR